MVGTVKVFGRAWYSEAQCTICGLVVTTLAQVKSLIKMLAYSTDCKYGQFYCPSLTTLFDRCL
jgi:hypothetical protein